MVSERRKRGGRVIKDGPRPTWVWTYRCALSTTGGAYRCALSTYHRCLGGGDPFAPMKPHIHYLVRVSFERSRSETQPHTSVVWICLISMANGNHDLWVKCTTSAECKTVITAVLSVMSGLDPHMINLLEVDIKLFSGYFLWPCWVPTISVLTLANCCSEEGVVKVMKMLMIARRTCAPSRLPVKFGVSVSRISCLLW